MTSVISPNKNLPYPEFMVDTVRKLVNLKVMDPALKNELLTNPLILDGCSLQNLAAEQILFEQGTPAEHCFLVLGGIIKITAHDDKGESTLTIISEGEIGGALLMNPLQIHHYPKMVIAMVRSVVLIIPRMTFLNHWLSNPVVSPFIYSCVMNRMREFQDDKVQRTQCAEMRITNFLIRHYVRKKDLINKKVTRKQIALAVGCKTETAIRLIKKFEREGILETTNSVIRILNEDLLLQRSGKNGTKPPH